MNTVNSILAFLLSLVFVWSVRAGIEGEYYLDNDLLVEKLRSLPNPTDVHEAELLLLMKMAKEAEIKVKVKEDGTFVLRGNFHGNRGMMLGSWTVDEDVAVFRLEFENGELLKDPEELEVKVQSDGLAVYGGEEVIVLFRKKESKYKLPEPPNFEQPPHK